MRPNVKGTGGIENIYKCYWICSCSERERERESEGERGRGRDREGESLFYIIFYLSLYTVKNKCSTIYYFVHYVVSYSTFCAFTVYNKAR